MDVTIARAAPAPQDAVAVPADAPEDAASLAAPALIRTSVDARGLALGVLATLATIFAVSWAEPFLVPVLLGIVIAYTLNPLVAWLEVIHVPRAAGALVVIAGVFGALGLGAYSLRDEMQTIVEQLPVAASKISTGIERLRNGQGNLARIQDAAAEVESATTGTPGKSQPPRQQATRVVADPSTFKLGDFLWRGSMGALGGIGQAAMVAFLVFFLLLGGDQFKRKLVQLTGPSLSNKKVTVKILDDINASIQKFMFMLLTTNLLVALLTWVAFRLIGLENAGAWAVAAGLLHLVPYLGPGVTGAAAGMAAFMQFDSFSSALLVAGTSLAIATLVGTFVTTWMIGRIAGMNSAAIFIALLFWGWLWGVWGMLLSVPIVVIAKVVSEHVEGLHPLAELLGD